jgi:hemerythrin-like domain-containing protein
MPTARQSRKTSRTKTPQTATGRASKAARRAVRGAVKSVSAHVLPALPHDAVKLLEKDHRRFERLMEEGEETTARARKRRKDVLTTLAAEIVAHERKEEKVLYPALKRHSEARDIVLEGYQEHHVADVLLGELKNMDPADERWGAKFKVLKESLEHHIEEEEGHMFRTARSVLGRERLEELGRRMQALNGSRKNGTAKKAAR